MRIDEDFLALILKTADHDDRIRCVLMGGSRVGPQEHVDRFSDFDIIYFVRDIRSFTHDRGWVERKFGNLLIMQTPEDWYSHPYDYESTDPFIYLSQFSDGQRLDLTLVDVTNIPDAYTSKNLDPSVILLQKDDLFIKFENTRMEKFFIKPPIEKEFSDTTNEFYWLAPYVAKAVYREQTLYAKEIMEHEQMKELLKLLNWSVGADHNFRISTGAFSKYLPRFLCPSDRESLLGCFAGIDLVDIFEKEQNMLALFHKHAIKMSTLLHFSYDNSLYHSVLHFIRRIETY